MLALLVPWRNIGAIHQNSLSLEAKFEKFLAVARPDQMLFMQNGQYYHESSEGVPQRQKEESILPIVNPYEQIMEEGEEMECFNKFDEQKKTYNTPSITHLVPKNRHLPKLG